MATTIVFAFLIAASLVLAVMAKKGHHSTDVRDFFVASRQFGGFLLFFLSVGEIYSIGTIIGFPGSIYAKGGSYGIWYLGYNLLAFPVAYFLNPLIWRAGKLYDAVTIADLFKGHFRNKRGGRVLELTVTTSAIVFLVPWGQVQFGGLIIALGGLGWHINPAVLIIFAAALAFLYIVISGIRAPAYVAILKDVLMVVAVVITGAAALSQAHLSNIFHSASSVSNHLTAPDLRFSMSTIAFQAIGYFMLPFNTQNLFTAKSEQTIRRTLMFMPLYMMIFPFLVVVAYYQLGLHAHLNAPTGAFMAVATHLLPPWVLGVVVAGASLSGLLVLAGLSLAIGPLVSRNLFGHVPEQKQRTAAQAVIVLFLGASIVMTLVAPNMLTTLISTAFFGMTQFLPGVLSIMFFRRANPLAIAAGIIVGDVISVSFYVLKVPTFDLNIGAVALTVNVAILIGGSLLAGHRQVTPVALRGAVMPAPGE